MIQRLSIWARYRIVVLRPQAATAMICSAARPGRTSVMTAMPDSRSWGAITRSSFGKPSSCSTAWPNDELLKSSRLRSNSVARATSCWILPSRSVIMRCMVVRDDD